MTVDLLYPAKTKACVRSHLDNPRIPKTTNALESFFGHLKENIALHRGMPYKHYQNYVKWYLHFRNEDNKKKGK